MVKVESYCHFVVMWGGNKEIPQSLCLPSILICWCLPEIEASQESEGKNCLLYPQISTHRGQSSVKKGWRVSQDRQMEDIWCTTSSSTHTSFVQTSFIIQYLLIVLFVSATNLSACFSKSQVLSPDPCLVTLAVVYEMHIPERDM